MLLNGVMLLLPSEPHTLICHHCAPNGARPMSLTGKFAGVYDAVLLQSLLRSERTYTCQSAGCVPMILTDHAPVLS